VALGSAVGDETALGSGAGVALGSGAGDETALGSGAGEETAVGSAVGVGMADGSDVDAGAVAAPASPPPESSARMGGADTARTSIAIANTRTSRNRENEMRSLMVFL
jgi:hypothetical protein